MDVSTSPIPLRPPFPIPRPLASSSDVERRAAVLAEMEKMQSDFEAMRTEVAESRRTIDRLTNKVELLENALNDSKVYRRKLIRLAAAMEMMVRLGADAEAIMKDVKEFEDVATEAEASDPA